jgi:hypothetical protein
MTLLLGEKTRFKEASVHPPGLFGDLWPARAQTTGRAEAECNVPIAPKPFLLCYDEKAGTTCPGWTALSLSHAAIFKISGTESGDFPIFLQPVPMHL